LPEIKVPPPVAVPPLSERAVAAGAADRGTVGALFPVAQLQVGQPAEKVPLAGAAIQGNLIVDGSATVNGGVTVSGTVTLYSGTGVPSNALGVNGDVYFRSNGTWYYKVGGAWAAFSAAVSFPLLAPDGTAAAPSYAFASNAGTGVFSRAAGLSLDLSVNGAQVLEVSSGACIVTGQISASSIIFCQGLNSAGFSIQGSSLSLDGGLGGFAATLNYIGNVANMDVDFGQGANASTPTSGSLYFRSDGTPGDRVERRTSTFAAWRRFVPEVLYTDRYDDKGNTGTTETDLFSGSVPGTTLVSDGDKVVARYAGTFVNSGSSKRLRVYFGGTLIFDTGALTVSAAASWDVQALIIRESSTVVRCTTTAILTGASTGNFANYIRVTGLTLSGANTLKITGTASGGGAATNDIVASIGTVTYAPSYAGV
jgi:hypothetical protein